MHGDREFDTRKAGRIGFDDERDRRGISVQACGIDPEGVANLISALLGAHHVGPNVAYFEIKRLRGQSRPPSAVGDHDFRFYPDLILCS